METNKKLESSQVLNVGIDIHKKTWHITGILDSGEEVFSKSIPGDQEELIKYLERWKPARIRSVYEAGYFGFTLCDFLEEQGIDCMVTPPSLIPGEYGNKVKTDRRDSRKLALYLTKGLLKRVYVPTPEERCHRQVIRTRRQLVKDRTRKQSQIKSFLVEYGVPFPEVKGRWPKRFVSYLHRIRFKDKWLQMSYDQLIDAFDFTDNQVNEQTKLIEELSRDERYSDRVAILRKVPGIGLLIAMELLLELQDVERFRTGEQLAAYVGLTPSQFSSGDRIRMGHITRVGKSHLRASMIEAAWTLVRTDKHAAELYKTLKMRAGKKRAIVAVARRMLLMTRSLLINQASYTPAA